MHKVNKNNESLHSIQQKIKTSVNALQRRNVLLTHLKNDNPHKSLNKTNFIRKGDEVNADNNRDGGGN